MQYQAAIIYLAVSLLLGYLGRDKTLKFWGYFLLSLLLSPIVGVLGLSLDDWISGRKAKSAPAEAAAA